MPPLILCYRERDKTGEWGGWEPVDMWSGIDSLGKRAYEILANHMQVKTIQLTNHDGNKYEYSLREKGR